MSQNVEYNFSAIDNISRVAEKIAKKVDKIDDKMEKLAKQSKKTERKFKKSMMGMKRAAGGLVNKLGGLALAAGAAFGLGKVVENGMQFEDSMLALQSITGANSEGMATFSKEALRMSERFGVSAATIVNSYLDIGSAKAELLSDPEALTKIVEQTVLLSKAGGIGLQETTDAMTLSLNIFDKGAESVKKFSDIMIQGTVEGAAKLGEFAQSFLNTGGAAKSAGLDFATTTTLIQLLSKGGEKGARAGTALNAFFAKMSKDFKNVDISSGEKLLVFLDDLEKKVKKGDINISKKFGEEAARAVRILLPMKEFLPNMLKKISNSSNATERAAEIRMAATRERLARIRVRLENVSLKLFEKLQPMLNDMITKFEEWMDSLTEQDLQNFSNTVDDIVAAARFIAIAFGKVYDVMHDIATITGETTAAIVSGDFNNFSDEAKEIASTGKLGAAIQGFNAAKDFIMDPGGFNAMSNELLIKVSADEGTKVQSIKSVDRKANSKSNLVIKND